MLIRNYGLFLLLAFLSAGTVFAEEQTQPKPEEQSLFQAVHSKLQQLAGTLSQTTATTPPSR
jgi:hypothetical protein